MVTQRDESWLQTATAEQIAAADAAGELDALQGRVVHSHPEVGSIPGLQRDQAWLDQANPNLIAAAFDAGELDALLGRKPWPAGAVNPAKPTEGLYGDGTIVTHPTTPRGDLPQQDGSAAAIGHGVDPKNAQTPHFPVDPTVLRG